MSAQGQKIGTVKILTAKEGVKIEVNVSQLPPGTHGIHIHAVGKCEGPDFTTAGPHLNPDAKKHGKDNPQGPHVGDLLNIEVKADGTAKVTLLDTMATLGDGSNSVFHDGGTAIVIHAKEDDYKTDPAGELRPTDRLRRYPACRLIRRLYFLPVCQRIADFLFSPKSETDAALIGRQIEKLNGNNRFLTS